MKKLFALLFVGVMVLSLAACGKKDDTDEGNTPGTEQGGNDVTTPDDKDDTTVPDDTENKDDTTVPDDTENKDDADTSANGEVDLAKIHDAVKEAYGEDYIPNMEYDQTYLQDTLGVPADSYEEFIAEGPMISTNVDTFVAIKAKEGKVEDVSKALNNYRDYLVADTMQYPMNIGKIQASRVEVYGDYVFFCMLGVVPTDVEEKGEEAVLESAKEQNQKAIDAIEKFFK